MPCPYPDESKQRGVTPVSYGPTHSTYTRIAKIPASNAAQSSAARRKLDSPAGARPCCRQERQAARGVMTPATSSTQSAQHSAPQVAHWPAAGA